MTAIQPDPLLEAYVLRVGAALGDVEPTERHAILADLRVHLEEVSGADVRSLHDVVGPPEAYAAELRVTAGLPPAGADPTIRIDPPPSTEPAASDGAAWPWLRERASGAWGTIARGWHDVRDAWTEACQDGPAWWLIRALLAAHVLSAVLPGQLGSILMPQVIGSRLWGFVVLFGCAVVSVRVGRDPERVPLRVVRIANVVIVVVGVIALLQMDVA